MREIVAAMEPGSNRDDQRSRRFLENRGLRRWNLLLNFSVGMGTVSRSDRPTGTDGYGTSYVTAQQVLRSRYSRPNHVEAILRPHSGLSRGKLCKFGKSRPRILSRQLGK